MEFKTILETLPSIDHLAGLSVLDGETQIHHIPAIAGKLGSLCVYNALAQEFNGKLDRTCAEKGLQLFAEYTQEAKQFPGKHPNIDLLFKVIAEGKEYYLISEEK